MRGLVVYKFQGRYYCAFFGDLSRFTTKQEVLLSGQEEEVFTISSEKSSCLELVRDAIAEADKRGISLRDIWTHEDVHADNITVAAQALPKSKMN